MTILKLCLVGLGLTLLSCEKEKSPSLTAQAKAVGSYRFEKIVVNYWTVGSRGHEKHVKRLPAATLDVVAIDPNSIKIKNFVLPYKDVIIEWPAVRGKSLSNYSFGEVKSGMYYARVHLERKGDSILLIYNNGGNPGHLPDTTYYGRKIR